MSDMTVRYLTGMSYTPVRYLTVMLHAAVTVHIAAGTNQEALVMHHVGSHT